MQVRGRRKADRPDSKELYFGVSLRAITLLKLKINDIRQLTNKNQFQLLILAKIQEINSVAIKVERCGPY